MFKMLKKYKRWKDFINVREDEVRISLILTLVISLILCKIGVYANVVCFLDLIKSILLNTCVGFLGLIGIALSGVAIIAGLFSENQVKMIEKYNGDGAVERIMSSFLLVSFSCAMFVIYGMLLSVIIESDLPVPNVETIFVITFVTLYCIMFNIFYTVSLVCNCIRVFCIRNTYETIHEKDFYDISNEIRIDFLLMYLIKNTGMSQEEFLNNLKETVERSNIKNKEEIIDYYFLYYSGKKK